jgi:hypothetical protein
MTTSEVKNLINGLFEEQALAIGGVVAVHDVDDDVVWRLMENLDAIRSRTLRRLSDQSAGDSGGTGLPHLNPHPAIEDFLAALRRG